MIRFLLRLYPKAWSKEYGTELAALLASRPRTPGIITDVLKNAIRQRIRYAPLWLTAGILLLAAHLVYIVLSMYAIIPFRSAGWFAVAVAAWLLIIGFLAAIRRDGKFLAGISAAVKTALLGFSPWWFAMCVGLVDGLNGHRFALPPPFVLGAYARTFADAMGGAAISGALGALCATTIKRFRGRLA